MSTFLPSTFKSSTNDKLSASEDTTTWLAAPHLERMRQAPESVDIKDALAKLTDQDQVRLAKAMHADDATLGATVRTIFFDSFARATFAAIKTRLNRVEQFIAQEDEAFTIRPDALTALERRLDHRTPPVVMAPPALIQTT